MDDEQHTTSQDAIKAVVKTSNHRYGYAIVDVAGEFDGGGIIDTTMSYYGPEYVVCVFPAVKHKPFTFGGHAQGDIVWILPSLGLKDSDDFNLMNGVILEGTKEDYQILSAGKVVTARWNKILPVNSAKISWNATRSSQDFEGLKKIFTHEEKQKDVT